MTIGAEKRRRRRKGELARERASGTVSEPDPKDKEDISLTSGWLSYDEAPTLITQETNTRRQGRGTGKWKREREKIVSANRPAQRRLSGFTTKCQTSTGGGKKIRWW